MFRLSENTREKRKEDRRSNPWCKMRSGGNFL